MIRIRFGIDRVVLVGNRGLLTTARIREELEPTGLHRVSALKADDIRKRPKEGVGSGPAPLRLRELVSDAVAEITGPDLLGEHLLMCFNPRKRENLLVATETALRKIKDASKRRPGGEQPRSHQPCARQQNEPPEGAQALLHRRPRGRVELVA